MPMKLSDFLIIYLSCGAPLAVYFFLRNRNPYNFFRHALKSLVVALVWIPYAFLLLHGFITKNFPPGKTEFDTVECDLTAAEKQLSQLLIESGAPLSLFDFREAVERYAGLTLARRNAAGNFPARRNAELFQIANLENAELGTRCLVRRNRRRLDAHQSLARDDFLRIVAQIKSFTSDAGKLELLSFRFAELLKDGKAEQSLSKIFGKITASAFDFRVQDAESKIWNPEENKSSSGSRKFTRLQALTATPTRKTD